MTITEETIKALRASSRSQKDAILVPRIERFMRNPVDIEDDLDIEYLETLIRARAIPRAKGVYSPSALSECLRRVYFVKTKQKGFRLSKPDTNAIFADGNFRHFKWQFVVWKMHRAGLLELIGPNFGSEVKVFNARKDYGGTIDQIIWIPEIDFLASVDYKGMNSSLFLRYIDRGPPKRYIVQSGAYAALANGEPTLDLPRRLEDFLIIGECKNGPVRNRLSRSPLGLHEWRYRVSDHNPEIARRIKTLRGYEKRQEIPPPECVSTKSFQFKGCPFNGYCEGEVRLKEKKRVKGVRKKQKPKAVFNDKS